MSAVTYAVSERIARITLNRPGRGNGITRGLLTDEGYAFQQQAARAGFKQAVRQRDEPFGDYGNSTYKG
jgi:enoyl-CoA hydratase/carnithine racemase